MRRYITAEDLYFHNECQRKVYLAHQDVDAVRKAPSAFVAMLLERGREHEATVARNLGAQRVIFEPADLESGFSHTLEAMRAGWPVIHGGVLIHDGMAGIPDLMLRVDEPSVSWEWHYRPVEIKLGSSLKTEYKLQVMMYVHLLEQLQEVRPEGSVILGDNSEVSVAFDEATFSRVIGEVMELAGGREVPPFIFSVCKECPWHDQCLDIAEKAQDTSLISGLRRNAWDSLRSAGILTLSQLADADQEQLISLHGISQSRAARLPLQAQALITGEMIVLDTSLLPRAKTEIFFDVESIPGDDLYYLLGAIIREGDSVQFVYDLAHSAEEERAMWGSFLDRMQHIDGPIFHYAAYEKTTIKKLDERYGPDPRIDELIGRLVDVEKAVRNNVILPLRGTSLKVVAPWLDFKWRGTTDNAGDSMVEYLRYQEDGNQQHLDSILQYNEDDCEATLVIRDWLDTVSRN